MYVISNFVSDIESISRTVIYPLLLESQDGYPAQPRDTKLNTRFEPIVIFLRGSWIDLDRHAFTSRDIISN